MQISDHLLKFVSVYSVLSDNTSDLIAIVLLNAFECSVQLLHELNFLFHVKQSVVVLAH
jgi:hypothetical protein